MVAQRIFVSVDSFTLLAVPFFILVGDLMIQGGISRRLIDLANAMVGWIKGGMAYVTLVASAFFGAISGSALATTSAIGGLMYPEMIKKGYQPAFAAALGAVGGTLGILIPPSIAFIIFGTQTDTSVTKLFTGGAVAGVIVCVFYIIAAEQRGYSNQKQDGGGGDARTDNRLDCFFYSQLPVDKKANNERIEDRNRSGLSRCKLAGVNAAQNNDGAKQSPKGFEKRFYYLSE